MPDETSCDISFRPGVQPTLNLTAIGATGPSAKWPPQRLDEVLLDWLRWHFADASRIVQEPLADRVWVNRPDTPILIQSLADYNPDQAQQRPAVLVAMGDQVPDPNQGIDTRLIGGCGAGALARVHSELYRGTHTIHCIGGREGESLVLGAEVHREIQGYWPIVWPRLCLVRGRCTGLGARRLLEEHKQTWTMPIGLGYGYWLSHRLFPLDAVDLIGVQWSTVVSL